MLNTEKLLKSDDVAGILNISKPYAYKLMKTGAIPTVRMGKSVRVSLDDLLQFIEDSKTPAELPYNFPLARKNRN